MIRDEKIAQDIEALRERLMSLIKLKDNLLDPDVVKASKQLDHVLNEYNKVIFDHPVR